MEAIYYSEISADFYQTTRYQTQKTVLFILTVARTLNTTKSRYHFSFFFCKLEPGLLIQYRYRLQGGCLGFDFRQSQDISLLNSIQNASGVQPASYTVGSKCSFTGGKVAGA
jgi:hypothetical protein